MRVFVRVFARACVCLCLYLRRSRHTNHQTKCGYTDITIRTVHSHVFVLAIAYVHFMVNIGATQVFVHQRKHNSTSEYNIELSTNLGHNMCLAIPFFHSFTFFGKVKLSFSRGLNFCVYLFSGQTAKINSLTPVFWKIANRKNYFLRNIWNFENRKKETVSRDKYMFFTRNWFIRIYGLQRKRNSQSR